MKEYRVIYEEADDGGWGAYSPDVDGVIAVGNRAQRWNIAWRRQWPPISST
jgi:hypothetical protein